MASSSGRGGNQRDRQILDGSGQLFGVGEIGFRHEFPQQPGFDAFDADRFFEMAGHEREPRGRESRSTSRACVQPGARSRWMTALTAGFDLVPQERRAGIDETALHAGLGDDEFTLALKGIPLESVKDRTTAFKG